MSQERSAQEIGEEFAQIVTGTTIVDGPAPAHTPLGRIEAFAAEHGEDALTPAHYAAARDGLPWPS
ncbi:hypothetical protein KGG70_gp01 [Streptomyces phage Celia]|uniref:Uncharacterized protein n=1 Tax=Streptomyces phage Celia TaxID=2590946 RepID=A0A516KRD5_9CAUD|nr:hypothetical protein KGG70_gp01 [Streptomyces phage Celia]QDP44205.1 hypothetical protein SEA_CELIA_1 [Streptomyces phage Celia]QFG10465.1 hypothetical protein SEA_URZA_1 [Streptomyces phage Urza]QJD50567.1 hypothetical protein SEA_ITZA_1 [Streptomyces phage Itza]